MRHALVLAGVLAAAACSNAVEPASATPATPATAPAANGGVDMATALKIERKVRLPEHAQTIEHYARFYYRDRQTPPGMVSGYYVGTDDPPFPTWPKAGIHLEAPNLGVADGGCFVIRLTYDPSKDAITSIRCNGFA